MTNPSTSDNTGDTKSVSKKAGAPKWALQPFEDFRAQAHRLHQILHLSIKGISVLRATPRLVEVLAEVNNTLDDQETQRSLEWANKEAELAQREIDEEFPILHSQAVIALWSALEAAVRLFVARFLQHDRAAMSIDAIQKLKVRIGEYELLEGEDRFFYIVNRLEQEMSAPLRRGVNRFDVILRAFGLSGSLDEHVQRDIFELNQVRNALVHGSGIADRHFVKACPWLELHVGDPVKINHVAFNRYSESVHVYVVELICRIGEYFGADMRGPRDLLNKPR